MRTSGLVNKMIISVQSKQTCRTCLGSGRIVLGQIDSNMIKKNKGLNLSGLIQIEDDCSECNGIGENVISVNKVLKERK